MDIFVVTINVKNLDFDTGHDGDPDFTEVLHFTNSPTKDDVLSILDKEWADQGPDWWAPVIKKRLEEAVNSHYNMIPVINGLYKSGVGDSNAYVEVEKVELY